MGRASERPRQLTLSTVGPGTKGEREVSALRQVRRAPSEEPPLVVPSVSAAAELLGQLKAAIVEDLAVRLASRLQDQVREGERADVLPTDGWLTVGEVARLTRTCRRTVYRALHSGALAGEKVGPLWRIRPAAVAAWAKPFRPNPQPAPTRQAATPARRTRRRGGAPTRDATSFKTRARTGARDRSPGDE
jgi:excisionase family DNA binding protein